MALIDNICPDAVQELAEHGYVLEPNPGISPSFVEARKIGRESTAEYRQREKDKITYEELDRIGLVYTKGWQNVTADIERGKERGLSRLSRRITEYNTG